MSAPVSDFQKLSLSQEMQSTRSLARAQHGGKGKGKAPIGSGGPASLAQILNPHDSDAEMSEEEPDEQTRNRVFALNHCRQFDTFYAFQIAYAEVEDISIRISTAGPRCSSETCSGGEQCFHIDWLLQQLSGAIPDTLEVTDITTFEQISAMGLDTLCEELQFEFREGADSDSEDTWQLRKVHTTAGQSRRTRRMSRERLHVVRDIMATLSSDTQLPDDYRKDIFDSPDELVPGPVLGDLEATISKLLFFNDDILDQFKTLVPSAFRARQYFRKALLKAKATIVALEKYCEYGPVDGPFDLIWCASTLVKIVNSISLNIVQRQPLTAIAKREAAKALVGILALVVKRNYEAYPENPSWNRRRAHAEPHIDRNLYERLIRTPPGGSPDAFVLDTLQNLPEARPFIEQLQNLFDKCNSIGWDAPVAYKGKFRRIIDQLKEMPLDPNSIALEADLRDLEASPRAPDAGPRVQPGPSAPQPGPSGSSGSKRPAKSSDRKHNKRMK